MRREQGDAMATKPTKWKRQLDLSLEYGPVVLAVSAAAFATFASTRDLVSSTELIRWILLILLLLSTSQLVDRFKVMRSIDMRLEELVSDRATGGVQVADALSPALAAALRTAGQVDHIQIIAHSGNVFAESILASRASVGTVQILLRDLRSESVVYPIEDQELELLIARLDTTIGELRSLEASSVIQSLSVRLYDFDPMVYYAILDDVELYFGFYALTDDFPGVSSNVFDTLSIQRSSGRPGESMLSACRSQFEQVWDSSSSI